MFKNGKSSSSYIIPVDGTQAIVPAGPLQAVPAQSGGPAPYIIPPNRLIIADENLQNSLGAAPNPATNPTIHFGVGVDINGNGTVDYIRWSSPFTAVSPETYDSDRPECGQSDIVDWTFSDCIRRGAPYTVEIVLKNNETESYNRKEQGDRWSFTFTPSWDNCEDCSEVVSADELMCGIYNKINKLDAPGDWDVRLNGELVSSEIDIPFGVSKLFDANQGVGDTTFEFVFSPDQTDDSTCENCINYPDLGGFTANGGAIDVDFSIPVTDVGGNFYTKKGLFERAAREIKEALGGHGDAIVRECTGPCCDLILEVNTCYTDFALEDSEGAPIAPTNASNPFTAITVYQECEDCDHPAATKMHKAGLRFYGKPPYVEPNSLKTNNVPETTVTRVEVYPVNGFNQYGSFATTYRQHAAEPRNTGKELAVTERQLLETNRDELVEHHLRGGSLMAPVGDDIINHLLVNEDLPYCVVSIENRLSGHRDKFVGSSQAPISHVQLLITDKTFGGSAPAIATALRTGLDGYFSSISVAEVCGDTA